MAKYTIRYVGWDDFDRLADTNPRYKNIKDSFAFADAEKGVAYVRKTPSVLFNELTAIHELEHLVNPDDLHKDENGIYHKKFFKQILHPILKAASYAAAPFTGGLSLLYGPVADTGIAIQEGQRGVGRTFGRSWLNMMGTTAGGLLGGATGAGIGSAATTKLVGGTAQKGAAGSGTWGEAAGAGLQGAAGWQAQGLLGAPNPQGGVGSQPYGPANAGSTGAGAGRVASGTFGGTSGTVYGQTGNTANSILDSINNMINKGVSALSSFGKGLLGMGGGTAPAGGQAGQAGQLAKFGYGGFGNLGPVLAGAGLMGMASSQKIPEPPSYEDFMGPMFGQATDRLLGGRSLTRPGQAASDELSRIISSPFGEMFPAFSDPYVGEAKRQNQINYYGDPASGKGGMRDQIINRYAAMGHFEGRSGAVDSTLERMDQEFLRGQNQLDQESQFRASEYEKSSRVQAIGLALGLEQNQMMDLINLAGIDVSMAALKYGIEVEDAKAIRDMFGKAGGMAIAAGMLGGP